MASNSSKHANLQQFALSPLRYLSLSPERSLQVLELKSSCTSPAASQPGCATTPRLLQPAQPAAASRTEPMILLDDDDKLLAHIIEPVLTVEEGRMPPPLSRPPNAFDSESSVHFCTNYTLRSSTSACCARATLLPPKLRAALPPLADALPLPAPHANLIPPALAVAPQQLAPQGVQQNRVPIAP